MYFFPVQVHCTCIYMQFMLYMYVSDNFIKQFVVQSIYVYMFRFILLQNEFYNNKMIIVKL